MVSLDKNLVYLRLRTRGTGLGSRTSEGQTKGESEAPLIWWECQGKSDCVAVFVVAAERESRKMGQVKERVALFLALFLEAIMTTVQKIKEIEEEMVRPVSNTPC